jgi:hypothetical protein
MGFPHPWSRHARTRIPVAWPDPGRLPGRLPGDRLRTPCPHRGRAARHADRPRARQRRDQPDRRPGGDHRRRGHCHPRAGPGGAAGRRRRRRRHQRRAVPRRCRGRAHRPAHPRQRPRGGIADGRRQHPDRLAGAGVAAAGRCRTARAGAPGRGARARLGIAGRHARAGGCAAGHRWHPRVRPARGAAGPLRPAPVERHRDRRAGRPGAGGAGGQPGPPDRGGDRRSRAASAPGSAHRAAAAGCRRDRGRARRRAPHQRRCAPSARTGRPPRRAAIGARRRAPGRVQPGEPVQRRWPRRRLPHHAWRARARAVATPAGQARGRAARAGRRRRGADGAGSRRRRPRVRAGPAGGRIECRWRRLARGAGRRWRRRPDPRRDHLSRRARQRGGPRRATARAAVRHAQPPRRPRPGLRGHRGALQVQGLRQQRQRRRSRPGRRPGVLESHPRGIGAPPARLAAHRPRPQRQRPARRAGRLQCAYARGSAAPDARGRLGGCLRRQRRPGLQLRVRWRLRAAGPRPALAGAGGAPARRGQVARRCCWAFPCARLRPVNAARATLPAWTRPPPPHWPPTPTTPS